MRVSRRIAAYSKPLGLLVIIALVFHFSSDVDEVKTKSSKRKTNKHKSDGNEEYEIGERNEFPDFSGSIIGRGVDHNVPLPVYRQVGSKLGNYEKSLEEIMEGATGTGDFGKVPVTSSDTEAIKRSIKEFGFNLVTSDKIALDRLPADLRDPKCKHIDYPTKLPRVSVIIVFHNEGWSPLMRTVHTVIKQSPKELLGEIVMVDDGSHKEHLGEQLDNHLKQFNGLVRVVRNSRREGLIRARSIGAQNAREEVLVFLDAHCEPEPNWLPPLLAPIARNDRISTVPMIDGIDGNKYTFTSQGGGDRYGRATGAWDWSFLWKRIELPKKEGLKLSSTVEPFPSPAMAGGLFAISREYFKDILYYDPGLEVWGGENFELSYKLWMCGGGMLFTPCSRVGHIYRLEGWDGNPPPEYVPSNPSMRNYRRVIETWWDEYKEYFYVSRPESRTLDYGDLSVQHKFRKDHCPHSFKWFMDEIAYGVVEEYPLPPLNKFWGEIQGDQGNQCLDSMGHTQGGSVETYYCHRQGGNQLFRLNDANQLMQYDQCLYEQSSGEVHLRHCGAGEYGYWTYEPGSKQLIYSVTKKGAKCVEMGAKNKITKIHLAPCDASNPLQKLLFNEIHST